VPAVAQHGDEMLLEPEPGVIGGNRDRGHPAMLRAGQRLDGAQLDSCSYLSHL
jgi:hypothetical protein